MFIIFFEYKYKIIEYKNKINSKKIYFNKFLK